MQYTKSYDFAGRKREIRCFLTSNYLASHRSWQAWAILVGGLFLTGLLGTGLLSFVTRVHVIEELVRKRTEELEGSTQTLKEKEKVMLSLLEDLQEAKEKVEESVRIMKKTTEELARSNEELDSFAHVASHDLKEPLRGISNFATFLMEDYGNKLDAEGTKKLHTLVDLAERLQAQVNALLQFSRVGRVDLAMTEIDLNKVVDDVLQMLRVTIEKEKIEIRRPMRLPMLRCDKVRIDDVFSNLITNAIRYNDKKEKWVEIGVGEDGKAIYVRDNGIGIPKKHWDKIFQIFKRLHLKSEYGGGTGVGLTIVKKIIERHNGHVWVESEEGKGTTFYFTLGDKNV